MTPHYTIDYWMKKLGTTHPYSLNERAKSFNLEQPTCKLFSPFPQFHNRYEDLEKRCINKPIKFDTNETLSAHIATFPPKNRSDNFGRVLEGMKGTDLRKFASNTTDELKIYDGTKRRLKRNRKSILPL